MYVNPKEALAKERESRAKMNEAKAEADKAIAREKARALKLANDLKELELEERRQALAAKKKGYSP